VHVVSHVNYINKLNVTDLGRVLVEAKKLVPSRLS
jgi:hypothetical protein